MSCHRKSHHPTSAAETTVTESPVSQSVKVEEPAERILKELPEDLSRKQRKRVAELDRLHDGIFSKHEFDIGRTQYVEYKIDTGDHRPIRQPLRRHPFKHLEAIDEQVEDMLQHGVIEPAASPWAFALFWSGKKTVPCGSALTTVG